MLVHGLCVCSKKINDHLYDLILFIDPAVPKSFGEVELDLRGSQFFDLLSIRKGGDLIIFVMDPKNLCFDCG